MNVSHLRYFLKLLHTGSYTEASRQLYITQPALSSAIKALESEVGFPLFKKSGRGIAPTNEGIAFGKRVAIALRELDEGVAEGRATHSGNTENLVIGIERVEQGFCMTSLIRGYKKQTGAPVHFMLVKCDRDFRTEKLLTGEWDAVCTLTPPLDSRLQATKLIPYRFYLLLHSHSELARQKSIVPDQLQSLTLITYHADAEKGSATERFLVSQNLAAIADYEDEGALTSVVRNNRSYGALVLLPAKDAPRPEGVATVPVATDDPDFWAYLVTPVGAECPESLNLFLSYACKETYGNSRS